MDTKTLKIFGTGQITVPKRWRELFGTDTVSALYDEGKNEIKIKPVKMVEMEETKRIEAGQLEKDLVLAGFNQKFRAEMLANYKKTDLFKNRKKINA